MHWQVRVSRPTVTPVVFWWWWRLAEWWCFRWWCLEWWSPVTPVGLHMSIDQPCKPQALRTLKISMHLLKTLFGKVKHYGWWLTCGLMRCPPLWWGAVKIVSRWWCFEWKWLLVGLPVVGGLTNRQRPMAQRLMDVSIICLQRLMDVSIICLQQRRISHQQVVYTHKDVLYV